MRFTRQNFIDYVFQPYNAAVKRGEYEKIAYSDWKRIRSWAYDDTWDTHEIAIHESGSGYCISLCHRLRTCPEPYYANLHDRSFGKWISDHEPQILAYDEELYDRLRQPATIGFLSAEESNAIATIGSDCAVSNNSVHFNTDYVYFNGQTLEEKINECLEKANNKKENKNMNLNFDFGPVNSTVRMSMYGMAVKNANGTYVAYDAANNSIMDVDILNFDGADKLFYKMPVAVGAVRSGDIIIHMGKPMFVSAVLTSNRRFKVVDIYNGEEKTIVPQTSPFGFEFMTKIISLMDFGNANQDNPFGNMLPFLLLNDSNSKDNSALMMAMMYGHTDMMKNPMLMYALMSKDGKMNDMLPFMLMGGFAANPNGCCGNCSCDKDK